MAISFTRSSIISRNAAREIWPVSSLGMTSTTAPVRCATCRNARRYGHCLWIKRDARRDVPARGVLDAPHASLDAERIEGESLVRVAQSVNVRGDRPAPARDIVQAVLCRFPPGALALYGVPLRFQLTLPLGERSKLSAEHVRSVR